MRVRYLVALVLGELQSDPPGSESVTERHVLTRLE